MPAGLSELGITDYNEEMIFFFFYLLAIPAMIQAVECRMCLFIKSYSDSLYSFCHLLCALFKNVALKHKFENRKDLIERRSE